MLITLASEDDLSESSAKRLIGQYVPQAEIILSMVLDGIKNVKGLMRDLNQIALYQNPVLVLADLDNPQRCPGDVVRDMTERLSVAPDLHIRLAVPEIESWVLADREGIAQWLGIPASVVPRNPESLADPKRSLVQLAARSRNRNMREAIAPVRVLGTNRTGQGYNEVVGGFVAQRWNPETARRNSPSLDRAITRIAGLAAP